MKGKDGDLGPGEEILFYVEDLTGWLQSLWLFSATKGQKIYKLCTSQEWDLFYRKVISSSVDSNLLPNKEENCGSGPRSKIQFSSKGNKLLVHWELGFNSVGISTARPLSFFLWRDRERSSPSKSKKLVPGGYIPTLETKQWECWKWPVYPRSWKRLWFAGTRSTFQLIPILWGHLLVNCL